MWRAERVAEGTLLVAIGARRIECGAWVGGDLGSVFEERIDPGGIDALAQALAALGARLKPTLAAARSARMVRVVVADTWLPVTGIPWSSALMRPRSADAFARKQLAAAGFDVAASDTVRLDDAAYGQPRMAVAYPALLVDALNRLARELGRGVATILPLSLAAWDWVSRQTVGHAHALAVRDDGLLMLAWGSGRLADAKVRGDRDSSDADTARGLNALWQRECLRDPQLARLERLPVLNLGSAPDGPARPDVTRIELPPHASGTVDSRRLRLAALVAQRRLALDAMPPTQGMSAARWALAGLAMLLAGVVVAHAWQMHGQVRLIGEQFTAKTARESIAPRAPSWGRDELARIQAVNAAIRELNVPIAELLRAMQAPRDIRVAVLSVDVSSNEASSVKIIAEARSADEMAGYVAFMADRKPFSGVYLTRHEIVESAPGRPYRFTVEAALAQ